MTSITYFEEGLFRFKQVQFVPELSVHRNISNPFERREL